MWLSVLHTGLEASYALFHVGEKEKNSLLAQDTRLLVPPIPRLMTNNNSNANQSLMAFDEDDIVISTTHCVSCGRFPPENMIRPSSAPLPQYGLESRADLCIDCLTAQGVSSHLTSLCGLYASHAHDRGALIAARNAAVQVVLRAIGHDNKYRSRESSDSKSENKNTPNFDEACQNDELSGSWMAINNDSSWHHVNPADAGTKALLALIKTPGFGTFRRRSRVLEYECCLLEQGTTGGAAEFLDILTEKVSAVAGASENNLQGLEQLGIVQIPLSMKKEAFKVAGDMSAAIKLLHDHAIPSRNNAGSIEMLACILEFLLDLCEEGELSSISFFWPQLRQIHLCMLPATDADALIRVELVEDFLITVSTRYSVHLALELVWGLLADLDEGMDETCINSACGSRRFAVIRFICELESILFDFDGGWGGGSISLHGMLAPSHHQAQLIKDGMNILQLYRLHSSYHLTRSVRLDKLRQEANPTNECGESESDDSASFVDFSQSELPMRVSESLTDPSKAKKESAIEFSAADYFGAQLSLTWRLGNVAEKLFHMEVEKRASELEKELGNVTSSRSLGGDPLSRAGEGISRIVRIPVKEGHVFRSKERTPVLLLMEVIRPCVAEEEEISSDIHIESDEKEINHAVTDNVCEIKTTDSFEDQDCKSVDENDMNNQEHMISNEADTAILSGGIATDSFNEKTIKTPVGKVSGLRMLKQNDSSRAIELVAPPPPNDIEEMEDLLASAVKKGLTSSGNVEEEKESLLRPEGSTSTSLPRKGSRTNLQSSNKPSIKGARHAFSRISPFGSIGKGNLDSKGDSDQPAPLAAFGEGRREVLTTILARGMSGNAIAKSAAAAAQKTVQVMDRKRAMKLMMDDEPNEPHRHGEEDDTFSTKNSDDNFSEDDEVMEALRILLIQNRVAKGKMSSRNMDVDSISAGLDIDTDSSENGTVKVSNNERSETDVDAGDIDPRLAGCGPLNSAIQSAINLWKSGIITNAEMLDLVQKDLKFFIHSTFPGANETDTGEDSVFWVRFAFGERWAEKKARIATTSPFGNNPCWDLVGVIVKSNDDLRQEAFVMQLIELCDEAFELAGLELWVQPYRILATGRETGIIETVKNAMSLDALKKRPGYTGLKGHFKRMTEFDKNPREAFQSMQRNFVRSLAAYSLVSYFLMIKDRHNGNLLIDTAGHVIHIDFGFVFGIAPGGSFSLEMSTPFKLTDEMLEVMLRFKFVFIYVFHIFDILHFRLWMD